MDLISQATHDQAGRLNDYRALFEQYSITTPNMLFLYDLSAQRVVYANQASQRILGYTAEALQALGGTIFSAMVHPDDYDILTVLDQQLRQTDADETHEAVYRQLHADGQYRWLHTYNRVFTRTPDGEPLLIMGVVRDVTAEKQRQYRVNLINDLTTALSGAATVAEVAKAITRHAVEAFGGVVGAVYLLEGDQVRMVHSVNVREQTQQTYRIFPVALSAPINDSIRSREIVWVANPENAAARYPHLQAEFAKHDTQAIISIPFVLEQRVIGGMSISFTTPRPEHEQEREILHSIARRCAQALERALLYEAEQQARNSAEIAQIRLRFLADASRELSASLDLTTILQNVMRLAVPAIADWCIVNLLIDGIPQRVASAHVDPSKIAAANALLTEYPVDHDNPNSTLSIIRSGKPRLYPEVPDELLAKVARDQRHLELLRAFRLRSTIVMPFKGHTEALGALTLAYEGERTYTEADLQFAEELAGRIGLAVENARLYETEQHARQQAEQITERINRLQGVTAALSETLNTPQVYEIVTTQIKGAAGAAACVLALLDEQDQSLDLVFSEGYPEHLMQRWTRLPLNTSDAALAEAVRDKKDIWLPSREEWSRLYPNSPAAAVYQAWAALPLTVQGETIGGVLLSFESARPFEAELRAFLLALARQSAQAIARARAYEAEQQAHLYAEHASRRLRRLQAVTAALAEPLTIDQVIQVVCEQTVQNTDASACILGILNPQTQQLDLTLSQEYPEALRQRWKQIPLDMPGAMLSEVVRERMTIWLHSREEWQARYPLAAGEVVYHAWAGLPLVTQGHILGGLILSYETTREFEQEHRAFLHAIAQQCAQALERARAYEAEQRARAHAEQVGERIRRLQAITAALSEAVTLDEVESTLVEQGIAVVGAQAGALMLLRGEMIEIVRSLGYSDTLFEQWRTFPLDTPSSMVAQAIRQQQAQWVESLEDRTKQYPPHPERQFTEYQARVALPLIVRGQIIGALYFAYTQALRFSAEDRDFLLAVAQQGAQAFERARLHQQAQEVAALHERQRLARELHDAVSQVLFSSTTLAEIVPRLWERNQKKAIEQLDQVVLLNRAAMAEMRTLLLELRPESIIRTPLPQLFDQLLRAVKGRKTIETALICEGPDLPLETEVHVAFYRVAQEALNNVIKHSSATTLLVRLEQSAEQVVLIVRDNGRGFDPLRSTGGLGLGTMRERASAISATVRVTSVVGQGTEVTMEWQRR